MTARPLNLAIFDMGLLKAPFFLGLRDHLAPTIKALYWSRRLLMRRYAQSAGIPIFPSQLAEARLRCRLPDDELRLAIGIKEQKLRGAGSLDWPRRRYAEIEDFLDRQAVDALLVWNGSNKLLSLAIHAARKRGIPVIHVEHGYFPGTMQVDLEGVNHGSSLTRLVRAGLAQRPPHPELDTRLDEIIDAVHREKSARIVRTAIPERYLASTQASTLNALFYRIRPYGLGKPLFATYQDPPLPPDFAFYPLQVTKDSQLLLHSPMYGNDHAAAIRALSTRLKQMNPPLPLVVKFHPQETRLAQIRNDSLIKQFPEVTFVCNYSATRLIKAARFVVTINSSVGFEAILLDQPLVTLGNSFYSVPALAEVVLDECELTKALESAAARPVRTEARRAMLRYCMNDFFSFGTYFNHEADSYAAIAERIRALLSRTAAVEMLKLDRVDKLETADLLPPVWQRRAPASAAAFEKGRDRAGTGGR